MNGTVSRAGMSTSQLVKLGLCDETLAGILIGYGGSLNKRVDRGTLRDFGAYTKLIVSGFSSAIDQGHGEDEDEDGLGGRDFWAPTIR